MNTDTSNAIERKIVLIFCCLMAIIPIVTINLPRSQAFVPGASATLIFIAYYIYSKIKPVISKDTTAMVVIIMSVSILSLLWATYPEVSGKKILKLIPLLIPQIFLISMATSLKSYDLLILKKWLPIGFLLATFLLIFEILNHGFIHNIFRGQSLTTITDPDDFNRGTVALALYAIPAFTLLGLYFKDKSLSKIYAGAVVFIPLFIAISLSESQASLMSLILGILFLTAFPYSKKWALPCLKYGFIALILITPFIITPIYNNFSQDIQNFEIMAQGYAGHRLEVWDYVSRYALNKPFFGYGLEATRAITDFDSKMIFHNENTILHPHNFVIQIWIEFGLFGALILCALTYAMFTKIQKDYNLEQQRLLLSTLITVIFTASVAYGLWQGAWIGLMFHVAALTLMANTLLKTPPSQSTE